MSQYDKILELYRNAPPDGFVCQVSFWNAFIRSPHKRRKEMLKLGYIFEERPCIHGVERSKDYKMVKIEPAPQEKEPLKDSPKTLGLIYKTNEVGRVWRL